MDSDLKERLVVLETLLKSLQKTTQEDKEEILEKLCKLDEYIQNHFKNHEERIRSLEISRATQVPVFSFAKALILSVVSAFIAAVLTSILGGL